jgi:hypothetical protein
VARLGFGHFASRSGFLGALSSRRPDRHVSGRSFNPGGPGTGPPCRRDGSAPRSSANGQTPVAAKPP